MADNTTAPSDGSTNPNGSGGQLTPAFVREVAEKVYQLWLRDLRLERERLCNRGTGDAMARGGRYG